MKNIFIYLPLLLCLFIDASVHAQFKPTLETRLKDNYYYKLNNEQAQKIFNHPDRTIDSNLFAKPFYIDPYTSDSLVLPQGNYLKVGFENNEMTYEYIPVTSWRIYFIEEPGKLAIQLLDQRTSQPITVAYAYCDNRRLSYDKKTKTYFLKNYPSEGVLSVIDKNETFYYSFNKERYGRYKNNTPSIQRKINRFLYKSPVRYGTVLMQFYNRSAMDAIRALNFRRNYQNCYSYVLQTGKEIWDRIANEHWDKATLTSYFYFNKPKYKPGDTVKFKVHLLENKKKGIWYDKPILVYLQNYGKDIFLGKANSKRKGAGYDFQFVIQDSMDLRLDKDYYISLEDLDSNRLTWGDYFRYEAYELKKAVFAIDLPDGKKQFKGKSFEVHFNAKDENGLPMPDTRAFVTVLSDKIDQVKPNQLFIPDTIWNYALMIKNGDDKIIIPDSVFPEAAIDYDLEVVMQNSENERTAMNETITFKQSESSLKISLKNDSIYIEDQKNDTQKVRVYAEDRFEFRLVDTFVHVPCALPLNTHAETYYCENDESDDKLLLNHLSSEVSVNTNRNKDSLFFRLHNPRNLNVVYYLYESGKEIKRGVQHDFPFAFRANAKSFYYLKAEYIWAGETKGENIFVPTFENSIKLNIEQPPVITPGKETAIHITATDFENKPVHNLNLLSYAYTQKFEKDELPELPFQDFIRKYEKDKNELKLKDEDDDDYENEHSILLDYPFWNTRFILDTSWTYRFRYPLKNKREYTHIAVQDSITQFAPFIMDKGEPQPIQYIYIDRIPVYLGFTDVKMAYSFAVDTNYHNIKIRTSKKLIEIDRLKIKPFVKTLFSIDQNQPDGTFTSVPMPDSFTKEERSSLSSLIMKIKMPGDDIRYAYLERKQDENQYFDLSVRSNTYYGNNETTIGPVYWRYWNFVSYNKFYRGFEYEPSYTYTFDESLVKMRSNDYAGLVPKSFTAKVPYINDIVLTKKQILKVYEDRNIEQRRNEAPRIIEDINNIGHCNLIIDYDKTLSGFHPINVLLCRTNDFNFMNIYAGNKVRFDRLKPGKYQIVFVEKYDSYLQSGIIDVKENGTNFYRIIKTDTLKGMNAKLINKALQNLYQPSKLNKVADVGTLMNELLKANYVGRLYTCSGVVLDGEADNEPLIGASIKLAGTAIGTQTDLDGNFEIEIPEKANSGMLEISYAGYNTKVVRAEANMSIILTGDHNALTEVVITTPYGPPVTKGNYVGAADVVTSKKIELTPAFDVTAAIEGAAPGVQVTNGNGAPGIGSGLQIRGRGSINSPVKPLIVINGAPFDGDITELDPSMIESMNILKDAMATSLYGSRGSNGVIIINTKKGAVLPEKIRKGLQQLPMTEDMMVSSLRNNFRDDAYWQPDLITDENGRATFKVRFPDDITNWKTIVVATDDKKHSGYAIGNIKSYKPVAASLYTPRFLLDGDSAFLIGKAVNYIPDTIPATTTFYQNDILKKENNIHLGAFYNDTLLLTGKGADSIKLKYLLTKEDGYFDGEEKTIPLQRVGAKIAEGIFIPLDQKDTSFTIYPTSKGDTFRLSATASLIDILLDEINIVRDYGYMCNEQKASKILALLTKQKMYAALQKPFDEKDKRYVQSLIDKIIKSRNKELQWGWWEDGRTIPWISNHVLKALTQAKAMGYNSNIGTTLLADSYVLNLERDTSYSDISTLQLLAEWGIALNYEKYISRMERNKNISLNTVFELILLRQKLHLPYKLDKLTALKESDIFGNIYWKDTARYVYSNEVLTTLNALKIIRNDTSTGISSSKVINWLIQQRSISGWRNTYESSNIIEVLASTIPLGNKDVLKPVLQFSGGIEEKVEQFPYKKDILLGSALQVQKSGYTPVYFSCYYNKWDTSNAVLGNNFRLQSRFENTGKSISTLPAGVPVTMKVKVHVEKSAEFVMIEIPIPAGCSYQSKEQFASNYEIHREYFEDKVSIFCEQLPEGDYEYAVELLPRYQGSYTLNPAKAELMYFPVFYGREKIKRIEVRN